MNIIQPIQHVIHNIQSAGFWSTSKYWIGRTWRHFFSPKKPFLLRTHLAKYPLYCRPQTSDILVFRQIFLDQEYNHFGDCKKMDLIIDCGANVGYTAAYFLTQFPSCHLIAIEPDQENFELLKLNLAPFGNRVHLMKTGLWSHPTGLTMNETPYRDGKHWSRQVRECHSDEKPMMMATDIPSILKEYQKEVSLLKMDIEGAESIIFSSSATDFQ